MEDTTAPTEAETPPVIHARRIRDQILAHPAASWPEVSATFAGLDGAEAHLVRAILASAFASAARDQQRYDEALEYAEAGLAAAALAGSRAETARLLATRAMVRFESGDGARAAEDLARATAYSELDPSLRLAIAVVAAATTGPEAAIAILEQLRGDQSAPELVRMKATNNLAEQVLTADPQRALGLYRQARELARTCSPAHVPFIEANIGIALAELGDAPGALRALGRAEAGQVRESGLGMAAEYHSEVASVLGRLRLLSEARSHAARALEQLPGNSLMRADAVMSAARLARADGDVSQARSLLGEANALYRRQGRPAGVAISEVELSEIDPGIGLSQLEAGAESLTAMHLDREAARAWMRAAELAGPDAEVARRHWRHVAALSGADPLLGHRAKALLLISEGDLSAGAGAITEALALIDARAALANAPDLRHRIAAERAEFEQLLRRCRLQASAGEHLDAILRSRPAAIGDVVTDGTDDALRLEWRELSRRVESADEDPSTLVTLGRQLGEVESRLRSREWGHRGIGRGRQPHGLAQTSAWAASPILALVRIGDDAVAIHYDGRATTSVTLGDWRHVSDDLAALLRGLSRVASGGRSHVAYSGTRALALELNERISQCLPASTDPLLVLLDRGLDAAPLTALPLIWPRSVRFASLALTASSVPTPPPSAREVLVAAGPRLTYAEQEAAMVAQLWAERNGGGLADAALRSAAAVRTALPKAEVVHVAAHASLRWDNPLQSIIHLDDGPLALTELVALAGTAARDHGGAARGPLHLLYLSACSLATAPTDQALVGAPSMLAEHTATEVVASSIPLPDAHAPEIAYAVHRALRAGRSAADGLAEARLARQEGPENSGVRAALACLTAYTAAP